MRPFEISPVHRTSSETVRQPSASESDRDAVMKFLERTNSIDGDYASGESIKQGNAANSSPLAGAGISSKRVRGGGSMNVPVPPLERF
jgi:hypothetical protein